MMVWISMFGDSTILSKRAPPLSLRCETMLGGNCGYEDKEDGAVELAVNNLMTEELPAVATVDAWQQISKISQDHCLPNGIRSVFLEKAHGTHGRN
jgi:hypothetical protein